MIRDEIDGLQSMLIMLVTVSAVGMASMSILFAIFDQPTGPAALACASVLLATLLFAWDRADKNKGGHGLVELFPFWRRSPRISPAAVDIILARAQAEPHLARAIGKSLRNALKAHTYRNSDSLQALDWIVRGSDRKINWKYAGRLLSIDMEHENFAITCGRLYVRRSLLPDAVVAGLEDRALVDVIDIPIFRRDVYIMPGSIRTKADAIVFDVFHDQRDLEEVINALGSLERAWKQEEGWPTLRRTQLPI